MIPDHTFFGNQLEKTIDGKTYAYDYVVIGNTPGKYELRFHFVSSNSTFREAFTLTLCKYKGKMWIDGRAVKLGNRVFQTFIFEYKKAPDDFVVTLEPKQLDMVTISCCVADEDAGLWEDDDIIVGPDGMEHDRIIREVVCVEPKGNNKYRVFCNDHECDDDFDDLIFDMEIITK